MAVLGKIRNRGVLLVSIIGLGLFAFIAEEAVRSCESTKNNERQQVAEVLGEKISYQEFQDLVDEYQDVIKMTQGRDNLSEDEVNQVRDMVWNQYVQNILISREAEKLGLRVTDDEIRDILNQGTNQMLMQTPFVNQQTGRFDANSLKQFISEYKKAQQTNPQQAEQMRPIYNYWNFMEKNLRQQLLAQKYQTLLANTFVSNNIEASLLLSPTLLLPTRTFRFLTTTSRLSIRKSRLASSSTRRLATSSTSLFRYSLQLPTALPSPSRLRSLPLSSLQLKTHQRLSASLAPTWLTSVCQS